MSLRGFTEAVMPAMAIGALYALPLVPLQLALAFCVPALGAPLGIPGEFAWYGAVPAIVLQSNVILIGPQCLVWEFLVGLVLLQPRGARISSWGMLLAAWWYANILRIALLTWLVGGGVWSFDIAHRLTYWGCAGSLVLWGSARQLWVSRTQTGELCNAT